jgi:sugar transferase (PEP-CTERM system associated)
MLRVFRHYISREQLLLVSGAAVIVFGSLHAGPLLPILSFGFAPQVPFPTMFPSILLTAIVLVMLHIAGFYELREAYNWPEVAVRVAFAFVPSYVIIAALGFLIQAGSLGRWVYFSSFSVGMALTIALYLALGRFESDPRNRRTVLLLGAGRMARLIIDTMREKKSRYELLGCVETENGVTTSNGSVNGHEVPIAGGGHELDWILKVNRPDVIVVASEERRGTLPMKAILNCKVQGTEVDDWPTFYEKITGKIFIADLRLSWLVFSDGFRTPRITKALKRVIDVAMAIPASALTLALTPLLAILMKLESPGSIFYRQDRVGESGRVFVLTKFRTMREDAERDSGPVWTCANDPRITRLGRFLRKMRLDELPQFFNVLRGEMSLVGPRPERPTFVADLQEQIPFYPYRHTVKPGITGWAQVRYQYGASVEDAREKLQYDLYYIKNMSIFLDLLILVQTIQVVMLGRGSR